MTSCGLVTGYYISESHDRNVHLDILGSVNNCFSLDTPCVTVISKWLQPAIRSNIIAHPCIRNYSEPLRNESTFVRDHFVEDLLY